MVPDGAGHQRLSTAAGSRRRQRHCLVRRVFQRRGARRMHGVAFAAAFGSDRDDEVDADATLATALRAEQLAYRVPAFEPPLNGLPKFGSNGRRSERHTAPRAGTMRLTKYLRSSRSTHVLG